MAAKQNDPDVPPNFDFGPAETLKMIKNPFPRNRFSRPKKYKLALEEKWKKKMRHKSNAVEGIPKSDVEVLSSMLSPACGTDFEVYRNYRTLNFLHELSRHTHNGSTLIHCIPDVAKLVDGRQVDGNCLALAFATLANLSLRKVGRLKIGYQKNMLSNMVEVLKLPHVMASINAASCIRNICLEEAFSLKFASLEAPIHLIDLLKRTRAKDLENQIIVSYAICNLCFFPNPKNRELFIQHDAAPLLLKLTATSILNPKFCAARAAAADAIANMSIDNEFGSTMLKARGAASIFVMATHEEQLMTWKSAGGALQNFNAVDDLGKSKVQSAGLAALTRMNAADVVRAMPLLRKAVKDESKPV
jgi:hypothetical protein